MSDLSDKLTRMADRNLREAPTDAELMKQAAKRIEELESCQGRIDIHNLEVENKRLNSRLEDCWREQRKHADEMDRIREDLRIEKDKLESAEKVIEDIAKAAECDNFADIIIARVTSLAQQTNAMTRICEEHVIKTRKAEAAANLVSKELSKVQSELQQAWNERDDIKGPFSHRTALLHSIADELGADSRNSVPDRDWYIEKIQKLKSDPLKSYVRDLEQIRDKFERCKNRIAAASTRWGIRVVDPTDYPQQLEYIISEIETWRNKATNAQHELDLGVAAIKRMYAKLQLAKMDTGIWPDDGQLRAKLDDIEWCLNVYISKYTEAMNLHAADTSFLGNVRDSLQHEIQRRSGK